MNRVPVVVVISIFHHQIHNTAHINWLLEISILINCWIFFLRYCGLQSITRPKRSVKLYVQDWKILRPVVHLEKVIKQ